METVLIDEREVTKKFVEKAQKVNKVLISCQNLKMIEYGLNPNYYIGGLGCTISSEGMNLEQNINNLFSVYSSNYAESIFFQCENIKQMDTLRLIQEYLRVKGLEDDFLKFRDKAQQKQIEKMPANSNGLVIALSEKI